MSFAQNPFTSNSGQNVSGTVASLSLMSGVRELHIQNISDNFQIFLPRSAAEYKTPTQFQISGDKSLRLSLMVTPLGSTLIIIVTVTQGVPLQLYHGRQSVAEAQGTSGSNTDSHTWVLPPELFSDPLSPQTFLVSPTNSSGTQSLHLGVSSFTARCAFWDTATQQWGSDGCKMSSVLQVGPQTSVTQVQCLCSHLSFFGSSFLVLPVQVDVTRTAEYFSQISENPIIVVLLACFYACYILTVTWARRMDLSDRAKSRVIMVRDNDPCALYRYRVIVCTGHRRGAATSAKVSLSLYGSYGQCGPVLLSDTRRGAFRSGSVDIFLLTTPFPLGELQSVTLSHDGTGPRSSWYVVQVTAQDMQLKKSWHFVCNSWLSLPPRGESLTRTFPAANKQELTSFRNIFLKKTMRGLRDEHIWISVLNHPVRSVFTRVQRVSCCMCLLLCTIVINLMFWELPQGSYPVLISMGSFSLTWIDIMIGFESALLMFPVNLLIIFIFRNTRPRGSGAARTRTGLCCCRRGGKREPPTACRRSPPSRPLGLTSVLEDLEGTVQTLSRASQNTVPELEMKPEYPCDIGSLLQLISHTLQKQLTPGSLQVSVTLAQLPAEDLHALFCSHYVCRKLRKVSRELQQLGPHEFPDKTRYDESLAQLQTLLHVLEKAVPPLPPQSSPQKQHAQQKRLPWWFLLIGWFLLVSISTVSTYFTMLYGFQYGRQSSIRWVISMALSLFQSIFILQPLKVIGFAVFFALVLKKVEEEEEELDVELVPDVVTPGDQLCDETIL
ncbi:polycystin-1-like protein 2 [Ascaphus truei]|uniref:polycystin-1-like protein 2 n=1 Tax=Ascaphus truei TaxID=8439 RepID=UPI003F593A57